METNEASIRKASARDWVGLGVLALTALLVSLDLFVLLLAIPQIAADLGATGTEQLWILDIYGFVLAGLLLTMGNVGDRIGQKKLLLAGVGAFGVASVVAAYSTSPEMLIATRALLGVAGATVAPATLSLIGTIFTDPKQRASAFGVWAGCFTAGAIIGPIVGGVLLEHFWWGSVFLLGLPAMIVLLVVGPWVLPRPRAERVGPIDLPSVALSLAAILPIVYGLKELAKQGWQPVPAVALVLGVGFAVLFARRQVRLPDPLLDLRLFRNPAFGTTLGSMLAYTMLSGGTMVFIGQYLQLVGGLSPLRAGSAMVPGMIASMLSFQVVPLLARRIRPAILLGGGFVVAACGMVVMAFVGPGTGLLPLVVGFALSGVGAGPIVTLGMTHVVGAVPPQNAGAAAGMAQTSNELGTALGVALLGSLITAVYRGGVGGDAPEAARDGLVGAAAAARDMPLDAGAALLDTSRTAFAGGLQVATVTSAVVLVGFAVLLIVVLRHVPVLGAPTAGAPDAEAARELV